MTLCILSVPPCLCVKLPFVAESGEFLEWTMQHERSCSADYRSFQRLRMFLHVDGVTHLQRYELRLEFNNGTGKDVDLAAELHGKVFEPLRDSRFFSQVQVNPETGTIEWPNGADLAPEFLFDAGKTVHELA